MAFGTLAPIVLSGRSWDTFVLKTGLCCHAPKDWSTKEYNDAGVILPPISAAPPLRPCINRSVKTPCWIFLSSRDVCQGWLAAIMVTPSPSIELLLSRRASPNFAAKQQSSIITLFLHLELLAKDKISSILTPKEPDVKSVVTR